MSFVDVETMSNKHSSNEIVTFVYVPAQGYKPTPGLGQALARALEIVPPAKLGYRL